MNDYQVNMGGYVMEYIDATHTYLVDGIIVPSITQLLKAHFGDMYSHVDSGTLFKRAKEGTAVHEAIEEFCISGFEQDLIEVRNFKWLMSRHNFRVLKNEVPVILFGKDGYPVSAGRLDLVLAEDGHIGLGDIKSQSSPNKEYLAYQLNLYRIAYQQCYTGKIDFLRGIQLKGDKRKYIEIPINEEIAWNAVNEWRLKNE